MRYVGLIFFTGLITAYLFMFAAQARQYNLEQTRIIECTRNTQNSTDVCEQIVRGIYESGESN